MTRMFQCEFEKLEPQALLHSYVLGGRSGSYHDFVSCVNMTAKIHLTEVDTCQRITVPFCGLALSPRKRVRADRCQQCISAAKYILNLYPGDITSGAEIHRLSTHELFKLVTKKQSAACIRQRLCTKTLMKRTKVCLGNFEENCKRTSVRSMKEIRISMDLAGKLMDRLPSLKIVHLIRDPRGIIASRSKAAIISRQAGMCKSLRCIRKEADFLCRRMVHDLLIRRKLETKYKERVIEVQYEAIAHNPQKYTNALYKFLGLSLPQSVLNYMMNNETGSTSKKFDNYGTRRSNSSAVSVAWRKTLPKQYKKVIEENCADFFKLYGGYNTQ